MKTIPMPHDTELALAHLQFCLTTINFTKSTDYRAVTKNKNDRLYLIESSQLRSENFIIVFSSETVAQRATQDINAKYQLEATSQQIKMIVAISKVYALRQKTQGKEAEETDTN